MNKPQDNYKFRKCLLKIAFLYQLMNNCDRYNNIVKLHAEYCSNLRNNSEEYICTKNNWIEKMKCIVNGCKCKK